MDALTSKAEDRLPPAIWRSLADNLPQLAWIADADGYIFWYNRRWYDYTGATLAEMEGWGWRTVHHPAEVDRVEERFRAALSSGEAWEDTFPLRGSDGTYRQFLSRAQPLRDGDGRITHWFGTNTDITEQALAEAEARVAAERLRQAATLANIFVWESSRPDFKTVWGENAAEVLGIAPEELPDGPSTGYFFVAEDEQPRLRAFFDGVIADRRTEATVEFRGKDGRHWHAEARLTYSPDGEMVRLFGATRDITAEARERRRQSFLLRLEESLRSKSDSGAARLAAATEIGRELEASRALYAEVIDGKLEVAIRHEYLEEGAPSLAGTHPVPEQIFAHYESGQPLVTHDIAVDPALEPARNDPKVAKLPIRAVLDVPLLRDGRLVAVLAIHDLEPRHWTEEEIGLAVAAAERTWDTVERARAEEQLRLSEAQTRLAMEELEAIYATAPIGLAVFDRDLRYRRINHRLAEMNGAPAADHIGKTPREIVPDLAEQAEAALREVLNGKEVWGLEIVGETPREPGLKRVWRENWLPVRDDAGEIVGIAISAEDVTKEHEAEVLVRDAEERYRTIFNSAAVGISRVSPDGSFLDVNDRFCDIVGRRREQIMGDGWRSLTHPDDLAKDEAMVARTLSGEIDSYSLEKRYLGSSGEDIWVNLTVSTERDEDGSVRFFISVIEDIGERKAAEAALRASEERYRALFERMEQGFCIVQVEFDDDRPTDYRFIEINPAFTRHTGLPPELIGASVREAVPGLEEIWFERYGAVARTGESTRFVDHAEPMGRWFEVYAFRIGAAEERTVAILFSDISERVRQERSLRQSELEFRLRLNAIPQMVWSTLPDGYHDFYNDRWYEFTGTRPGSTDGEGWNGMFHPDDQDRAWERWRQSLASGEPYEIEYRLRHRSGDYRWVLGRALPIRDEAGEIIRWMGTCTDIDREKRLTQSLEKEVEKVVAEREAAQEALRQSQKLEAMGQLTGGVAHDFNNLLTPIIGSLDLLQRKQVLDERTTRLMDGALASAEKARVLVQRLLAFARRQPLQPQAIDVARIVTEMSELIDSTSGPRVRVVTQIADALPPALGDGNQLEMALLNLSVNARDAMPDGGTLTIAVRAEREGRGARLGLPSGRHVVLGVSDTGVGMDEKTRRRAIEPFFSTKGIGKGTGLGLSMVHGLAAQLGGALDIRSATGVGTTIELWLPVASGKVVEGRVDHSNNERAGAGTALLVDDEELVRASTAGMLEDLGYRVVDASSGEEALALIDDGLVADLLITDQLMPGLSGTDLAVRLREQRPDLPVLIVSGYADLESLSPAFPHLSKPFRQSELALALERLTAAD